MLINPYLHDFVHLGLVSEDVVPGCSGQGAVVRHSFRMSRRPPGQGHKGRDQRQHPTPACHGGSDGTTVCFAVFFQSEWTTVVEMQALCLALSKVGQSVAPHLPPTTNATNGTPVSDGMPGTTTGIRGPLHHPATAACKRCACTTAPT